MTKVLSAHAVSVDGDTPSRVFDGFRLSEPSARIFDARVGAIVAGATPTRTPSTSVAAAPTRRRIWSS